MFGGIRGIKDMKILTINIHSHFNKMTTKQFQMALNHLSDFIIRDSIDLVALQECSQTCQENVMEGTYPGSFCPIETDSVPIRKDNFALLLAKALEEKGKKYYWSWTGAKVGYDMFDEGLAIFSIHPILDLEAFYFSKQADYYNWKSRKTIGVCVEWEGKRNWFYSVHMGWWKDEEEPFSSQMNLLQKKLMEKEENVFLLGDFNSQADIRGEGYDYVKELGWQDTYFLAKEKDDGITVPGTIDGWKEIDEGMRIDYIFSKESMEVQSSKVVFNGKTEEVISDHFGVMIHIKNKENISK